MSRTNKKIKKAEHMSAEEVETHKQEECGSRRCLSMGSVKIDAEPVQKTVKSLGVMSLIESLLLGMLGVIVMLNLDVTMVVISYIVGGFLIALGIYKINNCFAAKGVYNFFNNRLLSGVVTFLIGILVLLGTEKNDFFRIMIGLWLAYAAMARMNPSIKLHMAGVKMWCCVLLVAALIMLIGIYVLFYSDASITLVGWTMIGAAMLCLADDIIFLVKVDAMRKTQRSAMRQGAWRRIFAGVALSLLTLVASGTNVSAYTNVSTDGIAELNLDSELNLASQAVIVVEPTSGRVLYALNADAELPVASLTKLMTMLVVLEHLDLETQVTITTEMLTGLDEFAVLGLTAGQTLSVRDLLYATILPSAADAAQALALTVSDSLADFATLMNAKASELGLTHTQFSNPVGMDSDAAGIANYSTARDFACLLQAGLDNATFAEVFAADEYYIESLDRTIYKTATRAAVANDLDATRLQGAKTGFTYAAGRCLASTGQVDAGTDDADPTQLLVVTLGAPADTLDFLTDALKLYDYFAEHFAWLTPLAAGTVVTTLPVANSPTSSVDLALDHAVRLYAPRDFDASDLKTEFNGVREVASGTPIDAELGTIDVYFGDALIYSEPELLQLDLFYYNWPLYIAFAGLVVVGLSLLWRRHRHAA